MRAGGRLSVRARLWLALAALAGATLVVGATSWLSLGQATSRLDRLHGETLVAAEQALAQSRRASDLAARAPWLLTIESPFRIRQEAELARALVAGIAADLPPGAKAMAATLQDTDHAIRALVAATTARAALTDQILRLNTQVAGLERRYAALAGTLRISLPEGQDWLMLQRMAGALLGAGRVDNLVSVGEFQREFHVMSRRMEARPGTPGDRGTRQLRALAEGPQGLFELRRQELARQIAAEAALHRIRRGAEAVSQHAAAASARAQDAIAAERARTQSAIQLAKAVILIVGLIAAGVALTAALFVSDYVTANLRAISQAMTRLAVGDRSSRLPRGEHAGDEIGTLFHAFRAFRANALRLDRSNRQLAQRNALFQNLHDGMSDGLAILSETGALVARNSRLPEVTGLPAPALEGRPAMAPLLETAGWRQETGADGATELRNAQGRVLELRASRLATGGSVMLLSDVSKRRELDERLRQVQRAQALGKIAGEVAHDFGNILSTISTSLHLMETAPPERMPGLRHSLGTALEVGTALTQRLLAFARRLNLDPEVVDLNALVEGMEDLIALALTEEISLHIHPAKAPVLVRIDAGQMESALLNLCLNAAQAISGKGRIEIRLELAPGDIAQIEVADTGCGMAPEVLAQAMEPFFTARADGTGTGLGLAMVHGFIRQSGGDVEITSAPGQGTVVRLILPLATAEKALLPTGTRVLLVEDAAADAAHLRRLLPGASLVETSDPEAALRLIAAPQPFDLVITDLHLGADPAGWRIAEAALRRNPATLALVVSGRLPATDPLTPHFPGRAFCLPKPVDAAALAACLQGIPTDDTASRRADL